MGGETPAWSHCHSRAHIRRELGTGGRADTKMTMIDFEITVDWLGVKLEWGGAG